MNKFNNYLPPAISAERLNNIEKKALSGIQPAFSLTLSLRADTKWELQDNYYVAQFAIELPENFDPTSNLKVEVSASSVFTKEIYKILANADIVGGAISISNKTISLYSYGIPPRDFSSNINLVANVYYVGSDTENSFLVHLPLSAYFKYNSTNEGVNSVHFSASVVETKMGKQDYWNWGKIGDKIKNENIDKDFHNFNKNIGSTEPQPLTLTVTVEEIPQEIQLYSTNTIDKYNSLSLEQRAKTLYMYSLEQNYIQFIGRTKEGILLYATTNGVRRQDQIFAVTPTGQVKKIQISEEYEFYNFNWLITQEKNNIDIMSIAVWGRATPVASSAEFLGVYDFYWDSEEIVINKNNNYSNLVTLYLSEAEEIYKTWYFGIDNITKKEYCVMIQHDSKNNYYYNALFYIQDGDSAWKKLDKTSKKSLASDITLIPVYEGVMCFCEEELLYIQNNELKTITFPKHLQAHSSHYNSYFRFPIKKGFKHISPNGITILYIDGYMFYVGPRFETLYYLNKILDGWDTNSFVYWNVIGSGNQLSQIIVQINDNEALQYEIVQNSNLSNELFCSRVDLDKKYLNNKLFVDSKQPLSSLVVKPDYKLNQFVPILEENTDSGVIEIIMYELSEDNKVLNTQYKNSISYKDEPKNLKKLKDFNYNYNLIQDNALIKDQSYFKRSITSQDPKGLWCLQSNKTLLATFQTDLSVGDNTNTDMEGYERYALNCKTNIYKINYSMPQDTGETTLGGTFIQLQEGLPFCWVKYRDITQEEYLEYNKLQGEQEQ